MPPSFECHVQQYLYSHESVATAGFADEIAQFDDEDEVVCWKEDGTSYSTLRCGVKLTSPMKRQMEQLVEVEFADVFKDWWVPLLQHICLKCLKPISSSAGVYLV